MIKNNRGLTVVEGLVAAAIVATSILAIGAMVTRFGNFSKRTDAKQELPGVNTDVMNRARAVLFDTKDTASLRTQAICALLVPEENKPGVVPINVKLTNQIASSAKWTQAFAPDWTISGFQDQSSRISFTAKPKAGVNPLMNSKGIDPATLQVQVRIFPQKMDPTGTASDVFTDVPTAETLIDAKRVVFFIESKTTYVELGEGKQRQDRQSVSKELISVIDVGGCDIMGEDGRWLTMSPAGTGSGDPSGRTIYNDTQYGKKGEEAFKFSFAATELTQGKITEGRLGADKTKNAVAACGETVYRCPNRNATARRYRPFINVITNINYAPINRYSTRKVVSVRVAPTLELQDEAGRNVLPSTSAVSYTTRPNAVYQRHTDGLYYGLNEQGGIDLASPLRMGENQERLIASVSNAEPLCQNICGGSKPRALRPFLSLNTPDLIDPETNQSVTESATAPGEVSCTMCYTKACARMGYETFGPLEELPPEPLDSGIPECSVDNKPEVNKFLPYTSHDIANVTDGQCVSAQIDGNSLKFRTRSCNDSLPVACFAFGEYTLARTLSSPAPVRVLYRDAQQACRNMGREEHLVDVLNSSFAQQGAASGSLGTIPTSNGKYSFLNVAKAGSFVAPQAESDIKYAVRTLRKLANGEEFWVALRTQNDHVVAEVPWSSTHSGSDEDHMIYYNAAGVITHTRVTTKLHDLVAQPSSNADRAYVLMNHAKFRGVAPAAKNQSRVMAFLCMRKSDKTFFVSHKGSRSFEEGGDVCAEQQGIFVAPHSTLAWLDAMFKLQDNLSFAPFPAPTAPTEMVWVALQGPSSAPQAPLLGELAELGSLPALGAGENASSELVDRNGQFVVREGNLVLKERGDEEKKPDGTSYTPKRWKTIWVPNPEVREKVACYQKSSKSISVRDLSAGCDPDEKRIMEEDLKKPIYAMVWAVSKQSFNLGRYDFIKVVP